jgi:ribosomal-protein-alanine N-acetyltransferase
MSIKPENVTALPTLETERLRLRPFTTDDAPEVERMAGERRVSEMTLNIPHPYPVGLAAQWIASHSPAAADGSFYSFAVVRKDSGILLGGIAITPTARFRRAEIGYWLGIEHWNNGYTTEAARRIVAFGFEQLGLVRIQATCYPRNPASARVMQKIGMAYEGLLQGYSYKDGVQKDIAMYAMLRSDWGEA